ncbi:hypothetical protein HOY80DRAFT_1096339 [Tuber brumale]|nr:hypothetical protein HOY80DRAFT_1096339 [Tuber brumale]
MANSSRNQAVNWILSFIYQNWNFLLHDFNSQLASEHLSTTKLDLFASKIHAKGALLKVCWGFIDCTIREICHPTQWQKECYNGYKHMHAVIYSTVKAPDGRRNDNALLSDSELLSRCQKFTPSFYLYGDPTYPVSTALLSPFDDFSSTQHIYSSPIGIQYRVATILTNIHICLYGSETSFYFNCCPPTL